MEKVVKVIGLKNYGGNFMKDASCYCEYADVMKTVYLYSDCDCVRLEENGQEIEIYFDCGFCTVYADNIYVNVNTCIDVETSMSVDDMFSLLGNINNANSSYLIAICQSIVLGGDE